MNPFDVVFSSTCSDDKTYYVCKSPPQSVFTKSFTEKRANNVDPDELAPYGPTHQGLPCLKFNYMYIVYLAL